MEKKKIEKEEQLLIFYSKKREREQVSSNQLKFLKKMSTLRN